MDEKKKNWGSEFIDKSKENIVKFSKIGRLKLEIISLTKKVDEEYKKLGRKVFTLMEEGEQDLRTPLESDFIELSKLLKNIESLRDKIEELSSNKTLDTVDLKKDENLNPHKIEDFMGTPTEEVTKKNDEKDG